MPLAAAKNTLKAAKADALFFSQLSGVLSMTVTRSSRTRPAFAIRKELNLFANIRPVRIFDALKHLSPLKPERIEGVDFVVVRGTTGGIYFWRAYLERRYSARYRDYSAGKKSVGLCARNIQDRAGRGKGRSIDKLMFWQLLNYGAKWRKLPRI